MVRKGFSHPSGTWHENIRTASWSFPDTAACHSNRSGFDHRRPVAAFAACHRLPSVGIYGYGGIWLAGHRLADLLASLRSRSWPRLENHATLGAACLHPAGHSQRGSGVSTYFLQPDQFAVNINSALVIPIFEELLFRGWGWTKLEQTPGFRGSGLLHWLVISLLFGIWHFGYADIYILKVAPAVPSMDWGNFLLMKFLTTFIIGLIVGLPRWRAGRVYGSMILHTLINLFGRGSHLLVECPNHKTRGVTSTGFVLFPGAGSYFTKTGTGLLSYVPLPSCPSLFSPQH